MRCVIQKVLSSSVDVEGKQINAIQNGYMILVGITHEDTDEIVGKMASKIAKLRIFEDENNKLNKSIVDVNGEILAISQFTLYANAKKGNRPDFIQSARFEQASTLYHLFLEKMNEYVTTKGGVFGGDMQIALVNDGPVTILLDSKELF